jgi:hypothetical protein
VPTSLPARSPLTRGPAYLGRVLLGAYVVAIVAVCGLLVIKGPQMQAGAEAERVRVVAEEDRQVCGKLGMPQGSPSFAECAGALEAVRKSHGARLAADQAGPL